MLYNYQHSLSLRLNHNGIVSLIIQVSDRLIDLLWENSPNTINFNFGIIINVEHPTPSSLQTPPIRPSQKASAVQSQQDPQYVSQLVLVQLSQRKDVVQGIDQKAA